MEIPIRIEFGKIILTLENFKGEDEIKNFIDFSRPSALQRAICFSSQNPKTHLQDLAQLQEIHETIRNISVDCRSETFALRYWLSSIFLIYIEQYNLHQEDMPCHSAWIHLLKLRYHTLLSLYTIDQHSVNTYSCTENHLVLQMSIALRSWRVFCQAPHNHFWFREEFGFRSIEGEMLSIIYGENIESGPPHSFFLKTTEGREVLHRRFISEWLLNDRYAWWKASSLCCYTWGETLGKCCRLDFALFLIVTIIAILISIGNYQVLQLFLSVVIVTVGSLAFFSESLNELILPRLWVAVTVGYVPSLLTSELWKVAIDSSWTHIATYSILAFIFSWFYLRWEIGNRLRQTPNLKKTVPIIRSLLLVIISTCISLTIGYMLFGFVGDTLIKGFLDDEARCTISNQYRIKGIYSFIYPKIYLFFSSIALFLGIVLQIFWHDKPVTAPV